MLVHELFIKMFGAEVARTTWDDRRHFWGSVGRAMGQFLVDLSRTEGRLRRGGGRARVPIEVVAGELEDVTRALSPGSIAAIEASTGSSWNRPNARWWRGCGSSPASRSTRRRPCSTSRRAP
jgi:hypothetical protein